MRRFKNLAAAMMFAAVMTLSVSQAQAGFIITLRQAEPATTRTEEPTTDVRVSDEMASIIKSGIVVLEGILMSD